MPFATRHGLMACSAGSMSARAEPSNFKPPPAEQEEDHRGRNPKVISSNGKMTTSKLKQVCSKFPSLLHDTNG